MRLLLDTNAFLRWTAGGPVPRPAERALTKPSTERFVSIVSAWEMVIKPELGLSVDLLEAAVREIGAALLPIKVTHLMELSNLPFYEDHRDPFDRMLIAQALCEELPVITADTRFSRYQRLRVIWD